jgi:NAD(P)-dependent dehydrogenase (short-subunit alcohol dehydrogenase family)
VNNAGVGGLGDRELTVDGNELRFAVNYLATFLLTQELLPLLRESAPARVVNVASAGQAPLDFDDLTMERDYDPWRAYMRSKLAQIMYTFELASRLGPDTGLTVNALHPGTFMPTKMVLGAGIAPVTALEQGVAATQRLCTAPELEGVTRRYFDGQHEARAHRQAYDADARRQLWEISERLCS